MVEKMEEKEKEIHLSLSQQMESLHHRYDNIIYHYTTLSSACSIIQGGEIWLSDAKFVTDRSEIVYGFSVLEGVVREITGEFPNFLKTFDNNVYKILYDIGNLSRFYITSFSKDPDKLSQWRAYGDDGSGVALGFLINKEVNDIHLYPVMYGEKDYATHLKNLFYLSLKVIANEIDNDMPAEEKARIMTQICQLLRTFIMKSIIHFKHEKFLEEEEVRCVLFDEFNKNYINKIRFRRQDKKIVPYLGANINKFLSLNRIIVGPASDEDAETALQQLLLTSDLTLVNVIRSEIPYKQPFRAL